MQISKIILLLVAIGIGLTVGISHTSAIEENITFEELEIIPDPNRENLYSYIFNVCVNEFAVDDPKIMVTSDMEKVGLQLTKVLNDDTCYGAVEKIRAKDPDSIKTELVTYEIHANVEDKKKVIEDLKVKQDELQNQLREKLKEKFPESGHKKYNTELTAITDALFDTRKELQDKTAQYHAMQEYHHPDEFDE